MKRYLIRSLSLYLSISSLNRKLQEQFNFIDANHTGIWGWSYGGYAAAMALANDDKHVFRCAASVAPVTDWAYYGKFSLKKKKKKLKIKLGTQVQY